MKNKRARKIKTRKDQLMASIEQTPGLSLFKLAIEAGLPYVTAYRYMERLEQDGEIEVSKAKKGNSLVIIPTREG